MTVLSDINTMASGLRELLGSMPRELFKCRSRKHRRFVELGRIMMTPSSLHVETQSVVIVIIRNLH